MKKFIFTLEKLRGVKEIELKQKRLELEKIEHSLKLYTNQKLANKKLFDRQYKNFEQRSADGLKMLEAKQYNEYLQYLDVLMREQEVVIQSCAKRIYICREEIVKLMNEIKVLDRMEEEQFSEYLKEVEKNNDNMIEDFMQSRMN